MYLGEPKTRVIRIDKRINITQLPPSIGLPHYVCSYDTGEIHTQLYKL